MSNSSNKPYGLLVVDDHSIVRHGLTVLLSKEKDLEIRGEASTHDEAVGALADLKPDVMLVDLTLKDRSGLDLIRYAHEHHPSVRILVLSMHDEMSHAEKALRAGAQGYVMKEDADEVIVDAIRTVLKGEIHVSSRVASKLLRQHVEDPTEQKAESGIDALTERELEVFEFIGRGMSTRKIAEQLGLSERTVEVHRANIKKKLQCEDVAQVFREAVRWVEQKDNQ